MNKQRNVVLADRHPLMLESLRQLLEPMFDAVVMVADEAELIDTIDKLNPELVIADLSLPVSRDINVARLLKKHDSKLKVIILSVHDEKTLVDKIMNEGIAGFVLKRSVVTDLIPAVKEVRMCRRYISPAVLD